MKIRPGTALHTHTHTHTQTNTDKKNQAPPLNSLSTIWRFDWRHMTDVLDPSASLDTPVIRPRNGVDFLFFFAVSLLFVSARA